MCPDPWLLRDLGWFKRASLAIMQLWVELGKQGTALEKGIENSAMMP
jgi:hypothetical protein